jgi:hypothetical protein
METLMQSSTGPALTRLAVFAAFGAMSVIGQAVIGVASAGTLADGSLMKWQTVSKREELIGVGREHADVVLEVRIARIGDGAIVLEETQRSHVPDDKPVPDQPAGLTRDGERRITATAKVADIDIYHVDALRNQQLPPEDRVRGAGRGRFVVIPCRDNAACWSLSVLDVTDTNAGKADNRHEETPRPAEAMQRTNVPTYWADADTADAAVDALKQLLYKEAGITPPPQ